MLPWDDDAASPPRTSVPRPPALRQAHWTGKDRQQRQDKAEHKQHKGPGWQDRLPAGPQGAEHSAGSTRAFIRRRRAP